MTELLAGLVGGLLALGGGFGVQAFAGRQTTRTRRSQLIANFLSDSDSLFLQATASRVNDGTRFTVVTSWVDQINRSGHELAFLCPPKISTDITAFLGKCDDLMLSTMPELTPKEEFDATLQHCMKSRRELTELLYKRFGNVR